MGEGRAPPKVEFEHYPGVSRVAISGTIDERLTREPFAVLKGRGSPVVFDLDGATRITSFGVRNWLSIVKELPSERYYFVKCRPAIFSQFNLVSGFGGRGHVISFYCPYRCPSCGREFDALVDLRRERALVVQKMAPAAQCPGCGAVAEFDDDEAVYFERASSWNVPRLATDVDSIIDGKVPTPALHMDKTVRGDLTVLWLSGTLDKTARLRRLLDGLEGKALVIMGGLTAASSESILALAALLEASGAEIFLARVPPSVLTVLAAAPNALRRTKVVSVNTELRCGACGATVDVDVLQWRDGVPAGADICPVCKKPGLPPPPAEIRAALPALAAGLPPPSAVAFLGSDTPPPHPIGGTAGGAARARGDRTSSTMLPGTRVGKYEVIRRLGMGGMAEVLLGKQIGLEGFEKKVVLKRILPHLAAEEQFVRMFLQEARVAARVLHPNVVQVYDLVKDGPDYFAIMEYVRGTDLNQLLKNAARLDVQVPIELCCRIVADLCAGLAAAHGYIDDAGVKQPILHRDVSPHNALISFDGVVKLADFGVAKAAGSLDRTATGHLKGKVIYMAPELITHGTPDPRIDVYAAGLVLYVCLTQQHPFFVGDDVAAIRAILERSVPRVDTVRPDVPVALVDIVEQAVAKNPDERTPTAAALQMRLEGFLAGQGAPAGTAQLGQWLRSLQESVDLSAHARSTRAHDQPPSGALSRTLAAPVSSPRQQPLSPLDQTLPNDDDKA
ncbi:MAG: protein kinase [Deltaproteobacteria bacterium]|nr:protein kinase [Deltaproteobacteria bacterium]